MIAEHNTNVIAVAGGITLVKTPPATLRTIGERLAWAREASGMSQADLAAAAGVSQGTIGNTESGIRKQPRSLLSIARALAVNPNWLASGRAPIWLPDGQDSPSGPLAQGEAHALSPQLQMIASPLLDWDQVAKMELPREFRIVLRDGSMAPAFSKGSMLLFSTEIRDPQPLDTVLLKNNEGEYFVRQYQSKTANHWQAIALAPGYLPMDSRAEGLEIQAILIGSITLGRTSQ